MGDIIDNITAANNGTPYVGDEALSASPSLGGQQPIMNDPSVLKHSLDGQTIMSNPVLLSENANSIPNGGNLSGE